MQKKLQQLKKLFLENRLFFFSLALLFLLPIYSGEIIANSHAFIFGKYINYLHIRISLHLLVSIIVLFQYFYENKNSRKFLLPLAFGIIALACIPLLSVQLLSSSFTPLLYLSSTFHLLEFAIISSALLISLHQVLHAPFGKVIFATITSSVLIQLMFGAGQFMIKGPLFGNLLTWTGQPATFTSNSFIGIFEYTRVYGTTPHPNILAGILVLFFFLVLSLQVPRNWKITLSTIIGVMIGVTLSKSGILAFIAVASIYLLKSWNKLPQLTAKTFVALLLFANLFLVLFFHFVSQFGISATFIESRSVIHKLYLELLLQHPRLLLSGTGFTLSIPALLANASTLKTSTIWGNQILAEPPHNALVLLVIELGIPAVIGFLYIALRKLDLVLLNLPNWQRYSLLLMLIILGGVDHYLVY